MKKIILTLFLSSTIFAQEKATNLTSLHINVLGVGINYERAITNKITILGNANYSIIGLSGDRDGFDTDSTVKLGLEGRYYYNFDRRISKGKSTDNNSANYISLKLDYFTDWLSTYEGMGKDDDFSKLTVNYGIKRNFSKNFFYEFNFGAGFLIDTYYPYRVSVNGSDWIYSDKKTEIIFIPELGFKVGYNF
jgi:hypothetical protein